MRTRERAELFAGVSSAAMLGALLLVHAAGLQAQPFPTQERGLSADTGYHTSGLDQVNLFNGQNVVRLPLGEPYPVGPNLSYAPAVVYNSNGWDYEERSCNGEDYILPEPHPRANAGFGWSLELGGLESPSEADSGRWTYLSPDGGERGLYEGLHPGYPSPPQPNTFFSNDGTHLRLKRFPAGAEQCSSTIPAGLTAECLLLEFPDGTAHEFRSWAPAGGADYRLVRMRDRFSNFVDVEYPGGGQDWRLRDNHGRLQVIRFDAPMGQPRKVLGVDLSAFGGATATYTFEYQTHTFERQGYASPPSCAESAQVTVETLHRIVQPDGSFFEMDHFIGAGTEVLAGGLRSLRLPSRGELRWTYTELFLASQDPDEELGDWTRTAYGVASKSLYERFGQATPLGTWEYDYETSGDLVPAGTNVQIPCHHATVVRDPLGNETVNYFDSNDNRHGWSYALPFTRCAPGAGYDPAGPFLSQEFYEGSRQDGVKVRSIWVEYESDGVGGGEQQEKNHRLRYQKVVYHDDGERYRETLFEDYDGLGHYRRTTVRGNLSLDDDRVTEIDFNPERGSLIVDPATGSTAGSSFVMPAKSDPWVLGTFHEQRVTEDGETAIVEACFDAGTGFLERLRTLGGPSRSGADLLSVFEPETKAGQSTGRVARELLYGGDAQGSMDVTYPELCAMTLPATAQYQLEHAYASGVLSRTSWADPCDGAEILRVVDLDVDASTGLPSRSRDVSGVATDFVFDEMQRLTSERPAGEAWTNYEYRLSSIAAPTALARVTVERCPAGQTGCAAPLGWARQVFDGLGRPLSELRQVPGSSGVEIEERRFSWNALGWRTAATVWHAQGAAEFDLFFHYDPAGRLIRLEDAPAGVARPLKEYFYARSNRGTDLRQGKLVMARRHNYVDLVSPIRSDQELDAIVSESFIYAGRGGRISDRQTRFHFTGNNATFAYETGFEYETTGQLSAVEYPQCLHHAGDPPCVGSAPARSVSYVHQRGFLTGVTSFAPRIDYQAGGVPHRIEHQNGVVTTIELDPDDGRPRPYRISTTAGWDSGTHGYDGEGNLHRIDGQLYRYDRLNRMVEGQTKVAGQIHTQTATYDDYGNLLQLVSDGSAQSMPVDPATNRLTLAGSSYDAAGNLTRLVIGGETFEYAFDAVGAMRHLRSDTDLARNFVYTADDERLAIFDCVNGDCETQGSGETWTLRGLDGQVLREYRHPWGGGWQWARDYVYREGQLLAAVEPNASGGEKKYYLHLDHLGTPRQITGAGGQQEGFHAYHPFGREITGTGQDEIPLKFTGHERDLNGQGARGDLDYMHARFASPFLGRFLSFDPVGGNPRSGQSWNRYSYVLGNPVKYTDPYGLTPRFRFRDSITVYATISDSVPTGLLNLVAFGNFLRDGLPTAFGFLDVANARNFYQNLANQQIARGNLVAAAATDLLLDVLPETQAEFGVMLATSVFLSARVTGTVVRKGVVRQLGPIGDAGAQGFTRIERFLNLAETGFQVGGKNFSINRHFLNSLRKSGRRHIDPASMVRALGTRPSAGTPGSRIFLDPETGTRFFVNNQNVVIGVHPASFL